MLVLSRKPGESIQIGDQITVTVCDVRGDRVNLGIKAPGNIRILREELTGPDTNLARPKIVCLCGSTRFWREFQQNALALTLDGMIVLSVAATAGDPEAFGHLPKAQYDLVKANLDELHLRKIDLADEILVLNVGGYIGESTRSEIRYAVRTGKPVGFLEPLRMVNGEDVTLFSLAGGHLRDAEDALDLRDNQPAAE
jgi:carbon storage regulator CsrA